MKSVKILLSVLSAAMFASLLVVVSGDSRATAQVSANECQVTVAGGTAELVWDAVAGVSTYQIRSTTAGGNFVWRSTVSIGTTFTDTDSQPGEQYLVRYRLGGVQDITCTPVDGNNGGGTPVVPDPVVGAVPAGECVVSVAGGTADLVWGAVPGVSTYQIRSTNGDGAFVWRATITNATTFTDITAQDGEQYLCLLYTSPSPRD